MTARRARPDPSRHQPKDGVVQLVQQHRQTPAGPRQQGWAIVSEADQTRYVDIDGNQYWCWTESRRDATLFINKVAAERWAAEHIDNGSRKAVQIAR